MYRKTLCAMAIAVAWSAPLSVRAQDAELSKIREEIRQMKDAYEKRIEALEKRLQETEAKAGKAETAASNAENTANQAAAELALLLGASGFRADSQVAKTRRDLS